MVDTVALLNASTEQKLKRRKLDALRRGVHRLGAGEALAVNIHVVGIGKAGTATIAELVRSQEKDAPKLSALAIDIGDDDLAALRALADAAPERTSITTMAIGLPPKEAVLESLGRYPDFLALEYPNYCWGPNHRAWLGPSFELPEPSGHVRRAIAKALYGHAYYADARPVQSALREFARQVETTGGQSVIAIVFGLAGGTGSGIAVDLARHLSSRIFGRRVLVAGIGIGPCSADPAEQSGGQMFAMLNELDCLGDESKNEGIVRSCGELFRNPFTAGFIVVPQEHVYKTLGNLDATHRRVDEEIAALLGGRGGVNLWETLRMLNWVAAPSTQHSAARTPWGARWIHMLGFADVADGPIGIDRGLPGKLGLLPGYGPEFIEARVPPMPDDDKVSMAARLEDVFAPDVMPQIVDGGRPGSVQFMLPSIAKIDLAWFAEVRDAYDSETQDQRTLDHSMLLDQCVVLSEPSSRLRGMAGASLAGSESWVAVPFAALRGDLVECGHAA